MLWQTDAGVLDTGQLTIVTGPIDSGKTRWCRDFAAANPACAGLLLLKVYLHGARVGYDALHLPGGERLPFARVAGHEPAGWVPAERIGPFSMSRAGLQAANRWLIRAAASSGDIIVDEVGPLELAGGGLARGLRAVLDSPPHRRVYLVVRRDCLEAVCDHYGIRGCAVVDVGAGTADG
jgi:nucleoside-triphosphatase THEP1